MQPMHGHQRSATIIIAASPPLKRLFLQAFEPTYTRTLSSFLRPAFTELSWCQHQHPYASTHISRKNINSSPKKMCRPPELVIPFSFCTSNRSGSFCTHGIDNSCTCYDSTIHSIERHLGLSNKCHLGELDFKARQRRMEAPQLSLRGPGHASDVISEIYRSCRQNNSLITPKITPYFQLCPAIDIIYLFCICRYSRKCPRVYR